MLLKITIASIWRGKTWGQTLLYRTWMSNELDISHCFKKKWDLESSQAGWLVKNLLFFAEKDSATKLLTNFITVLRLSAQYYYVAVWSSSGPRLVYHRMRVKAEEHWHCSAGTRRIRGSGAGQAGRGTCRNFWLLPTETSTLQVRRPYAIKYLGRRVEAMRSCCQAFARRRSNRRCCEGCLRVPAHLSGRLSDTRKWGWFENHPGKASSPTRDMCVTF